MTYDIRAKRDKKNDHHKSMNFAQSDKQLPLRSKFNPSNVVRSHVTPDTPFHTGRARKGRAGAVIK